MLWIILRSKTFKTEIKQFCYLCSGRHSLHRSLPDWVPARRASVHQDPAAHGHQGHPQERPEHPRLHPHGRRLRRHLPGQAEQLLPGSRLRRGHSLGSFSPLKQRQREEQEQEHIQRNQFFNDEWLLCVKSSTFYNLLQCTL